MTATAMNTKYERQHESGWKSDKDEVGAHDKRGRTDAAVWWGEHGRQCNPVSSQSI